VGSWVVVELDPLVQLRRGVVDRAEGLAVEELAAQRQCHRSIFTVVVGDRGAVNRCLIPFSVQIRSKSTGPGPGPNGR
jgi:hypothetical protein